MRMRLYVCTLTLCLATAAQNQPVAFAHDTIGGATDAAMAAAAGNFLTSLTPQLRAKATFPRDSKERTNWHFVPKERLGVSLKEMDLPQRRAAHRLLQSALSAKGYLKATTIMSLEQVLRVLESDRPGAEQMRDQEKYWFAIFGAPLEDIPWGWRVEGHHVSLIEYDNTQNNANHIHTVWHSLNNDFGLDTLRRHYQESPHHAAGR